MMKKKEMTGMGKDDDMSAALKSEGTSEALVPTEEEGVGCQGGLSGGEGRADEGSIQPHAEGAGHSAAAGKMASSRSHIFFDD